MGIKRRLEALAWRCKLTRRPKRAIAFYAPGDRLDRFLRARLAVDVEYVGMDDPETRRDLAVLCPHVGKGSGTLTAAKQLEWGDPSVRDAYLAVPATRRLFWTGENTELKAHHAWDDYGAGAVDFSLGFKRLPDSASYLRFPLWLSYLFGSCRSDGAIRRRVARLNAAQSTGKRFCALVANHDLEWEYGAPRSPAPLSGVRTRLHAIASEIGEVSCPSTLFHNDDSLKRTYGDDKGAYLRQFQFNLCPENSAGDGYVTEKLFHAFAAGCVPVYWGPAPSELRELVNTDALLYYDGTNGAELRREMARLHASDRLRRSFLAQPKLLPDAVDFVASRFKALETRLAELLSL